MQAVANIVLLFLFLDGPFQFHHIGVMVQTVGGKNTHHCNQATPTVGSILKPPSWGKILIKVYIISIKTTWEKHVYKHSLLLT